MGDSVGHFEAGGRGQAWGRQPRSLCQTTRGSTSRQREDGKSRRHQWQVKIHAVNYTLEVKVSGPSGLALWVKV